jgi:hypothetical protein
MSEVTFCHFDRLFDDPSLRQILVRIFMSVNPRDLDNCVRVCTAWRLFIGRHLVAAEGVGQQLRRRKMPEEWLNKVVLLRMINGCFKTNMKYCILRKSLIKENENMSSIAAWSDQISSRYVG